MHVYVYRIPGCVGMHIYVSKYNAEVHTAFEF
jgi:hypothetical protein